MKNLLSLSLCILASIPTALFAHEGHGNIVGSHPLHYLAEPYHVLVLLVTVSAFAGLTFHLRKRKTK